MTKLYKLFYSLPFLKVGMGINQDHQTLILSDVKGISIATIDFICYGSVPSNPYCLTMI